MRAYELLDSRAIYRNPWIAVREDRVRRPDGETATFGVVDMKSGSTVLALTESGEVLLVREFKYAVGRETVELISGAIEPGETPLDAARRELREEAGVEAECWTEMGVIDPFTTAIRSPNYLFLAEGLREAGRSPDAGEVVEPFRVPFEEALEMVGRGEITHAASCVLLLKAAATLRFSRE